MWSTICVSSGQFLHRAPLMLICLTDRQKAKDVQWENQIFTVKKPKVEDV